jgi:hypothetical protein
VPASPPSPSLSVVNEGKMEIPDDPTPETEDLVYLTLYPLPNLQMTLLGVASSAVLLLLKPAGKNQSGTFLYVFTITENSMTLLVSC